jgi:enterochelin esterase-like enzyme
MKRSIAIALSWALLSAAWAYRTAAGDDEESAADYASPRIAQLAEHITGDEVHDREIIDTFVQEMKGKAPLVELTREDHRSRWITFLWRGGASTSRVSVLGGPATAEFGAKLRPLKKSTLWFRTDKVPSDSRFGYHFMVDFPEKVPKSGPAAAKFWQTHSLLSDPLNESKASIVELPDAPRQWWLDHVSATDAGSIFEAKIESKVLNQERKYAVYTSPRYDPDRGTYPLLVMFDGEDCRCSEATDPFPVGTILDNLVLQKKIPPLVTLFIYQTEERSKELSCSPEFVRFLTDELLPRVRSNYRISKDTEKTVIAGMSLGGLMSTYCAYRHPEIFGNVLSLSGSYQWSPGTFEHEMNVDSEPGWLTRELVDAPKAPVRFYIAAGKFEHFYPNSLLSENRRLRDVLKAKNYSVNYTEFSGGHDPICWRSVFVEGLIALIGSSEPN